MAGRSKVSHARLIELLSYDPMTGIFCWKLQQSRRNHPGDIAGCLGAGDYRQIQIDGRQYKAHKLAWFYIHRRWPRLDHKNGDRDDNRIDNLRPASHAQNCQNACRPRTNTSGFKGVSRIDKRWRAAIRKNGARIYLGRFDTAEEAHTAYSAAALKLHGEFARLR